LINYVEYGGPFALECDLPAAVIHQEDKYLAFGPKSLNPQSHITFEHSFTKSSQEGYIYVTILLKDLKLIR
jgi:hypothetical protein